MRTSAARLRPRWRAGTLLVGGLLVSLLGAPAPAAAGKKKGPGPRAPSPEYPAKADSTPASAAARLDSSACAAELERAGVRFHVATPAPGVKIPVRLDGPVAGVTYRTDHGDRDRNQVPYEVFDCRLVVALVGFGPILERHGIKEVRIFSAWRPPPARFPAGKVADRHPGGLAVDFRAFRKSTGEELDVLRDFNGRLGEAPCDPSRKPPSPSAPAAAELRAILCEAAKARLFHVLLSPNHDLPHRNHFHAEVRPGVGWFILR